MLQLLKRKFLYSSRNAELNIFNAGSSVLSITISFALFEALKLDIRSFLDFQFEDNRII